MDNQLLDFVVLALYFAVMIGAGYWGLRRARSADDYLVAGRRLGPFMYIGCLAAVVLGGASTIGGVTLGYGYGISGMWLVFWIGMGVIALGILMSSRLSRLGVYTVSEMLENRYGAASRLISAIIIAAYALMIAVTSTIAIGTGRPVARHRQDRGGGRHLEQAEAAKRRRMGAHADAPRDREETVASTKGLSHQP